MRVVLVHGAWHGAWCFERVLPHLHRMGIDSTSIDLPGHGQSHLPFSDLHGDAAFVSSVLDGLDSDVVLLGHSYGGAVITEAGGHPLVRRLVYLTALMPGPGESCLQLSDSIRGVLGAEALASIAPFDWEFREDGTTVWKPDAVRDALYNDCDDVTVEWALERLGPHPMVTLDQAPTAVAWKDVPSTYLLCSKDQSLIPEMQSILARRCEDQRVLPTSHSPFLSAPALLAQELHDICSG